MSRVPPRSRPLAQPRPQPQAQPYRGADAAEGKVVRISSRTNPLLAQLRKLTRDPSAYRTHGAIWLEGDHLCRACVARARPVAQAVITASAWSEDAELRVLAMHADRIAVVADELFSSLSGLESPACIGFLLAHEKEVEIRPGERTVVLDRLQDAGNVGTILRSAAALGFTQVLAIKGCTALWSPKVLRAAMGAHFGLHLVELADAGSAGRLGVPLVAGSSHAEASLTSVALPDPCAWVFGHEGQGVDTALMERCALTVRIPQPGGEESLNVASAAAICLYESLRQRSQAEK